MKKLKIISIIGIALTLLLSLNAVSAYSHGTFDISEKWKYNEDIIGEDRGFTFKHSLDLPRNTCGYYDWSAKPKVCFDALHFFPRTKDPDRIVLEAFRTFQQDSSAQNAIELEREKRRFSFFSYRYPNYGYGYGYYGSYYPRYYGYY